MHCPFRNFLQSTDMAEGRVWRKKLWKQALDICSAMEIPIAVIHAMNRDEYNYDYNQLPYVCELLFELSEYSIAQGVKLAVENISSSHIPGNEILCTLSEQTKLFKAIPNLYYCLDIGHVTITNDDMKAEIDSSIDKLITLHIHNNDGKSDRHDLPDTGVIDWPYWYDYLRKKGYDGQFVLEVASGEDSFNRLDSLKRLFIGDCR
jgi:sugar phosphate isomerase/epimerase